MAWIIFVATGLCLLMFAGRSRGIDKKIDASPMRQGAGVGLDMLKVLFRSSGQRGMNHAPHTAGEQGGKS